MTKVEIEKSIEKFLAKYKYTKLKKVKGQSKWVRV